MPEVTFDPAGGTVEEYLENAEVPKTAALTARLRKFEREVPRVAVTVKDIDRLIERTNAHYAKRPR
ncbi:hypothetical protein MesoLj131b_76690 (plasmid) [Mesorhizobium sp. 131-2-5]|uniref:hypothetical protein n=1 Tax=Mesorhizobium sp. 131-2-5 TaxID=2744519 RepID=UPI0018EA8FB6|nr:hypothetical protein [Mesorhizobium sp. 131-2-5]BCH05670.1 hypothetical protein MesoLj131b_76690 [Mesorhizobium sp. 131-2-5]